MLKRSSLNRIVKMTMLLFVLFLLYLFPSKKTYNLNAITTISSSYHDIFLIDKNGYVSKTKIAVKNIEKEELAKELLEYLVINKSNKIPSSFKAVIPEDTKINFVKVDNEHIKVSFSSSVLKTNNKEKMIECITYTLTSISNIKFVNILVDDEYNNFFEEEYSRDIGVNKVLDISSLKDITRITIYYNSNSNGNNYYIPVTKYINSKDDKVNIIIDELSSKSSYESNLISYLNYDTKLMSYTLEDNEINLYFNNSILNSKNDNKILEEVIYSISYSLEDSIEVNNVHFYVNNKEF